MSAKRISNQKRKRDACEPPSLSKHLQPSQKRQKNDDCNTTLQLASPPSMASSGNLLSDETLFLHDVDTEASASECKSESDRESSTDERGLRNLGGVFVDLNSTYQTPAQTLSIFDDDDNTGSQQQQLTSVISLSSPSDDDDDEEVDSPLLRQRVSSTRTRARIRIDTISINALSVLYGYLSLGDILQMSKTSRFFGQQSFTLLSRLAPVCKCVYGVPQRRITTLMSRCSSYLKHLDLTNVAAVIDDDVVATVSARCEQLTSVCLHGCQSVTDAAVMQLLSRCRWIRRLDVSGVSQLTSAIAEPMARCHKLRYLNLAWCTEINGDIVPTLVYLAHNHALRVVNLHCCNTFITFYYSFQSVFECLDARMQPGLRRHQHEAMDVAMVHNKKKKEQEEEQVRFRLNDDGRLRLVGGLQQKTLNAELFEEHRQDLLRRGVVYVHGDRVGYASLAEFDHRYRMERLLESTHISTAMYDATVRKSGYRLYAVHNSDKIYMVVITENGVFGTKLLPQKDFQCARDDFMATLQRSDRNPIAFLKNECDLANWSWLDEFQSRRCLALLGMHTHANWINITALKYCPAINAFIDSTNSSNKDTNKQNLNLNDAN